MKQTNNNQIVSKLTRVYLNYGIVPISSKYKNQFPKGTKSIKIDVLFDDQKTPFSLTFDPLQSRFFGVKGWYTAHNAKPGDEIIIEHVIPNKLYRFCLKPKTIEGVAKSRLEEVKISKKKGRKISIVGKPINYGGLMYAPINELGVILLFGMIFEEMGMIVEEIRSGFPDAIIRRFNGRGWTRETVEFEYKSMEYKKHNHPLNGCDIIICWIDNWGNCPLEVWELSELIKLLPRDTIDQRLKNLQQKL